MSTIALKLLSTTWSRGLILGKGVPTVRLSVSTISVLAALMASSCDTSLLNQKSKQSAPSDGDRSAIVDRLVEKYGGNAQPVGRYQILLTQRKTLKLDTATGQTWALEGPIWKPLKTEPATDSSDPLGIRTGQAQAVPINPKTGKPYSRVVTLKNGKRIGVTNDLGDGTFDGDELK